MTTKTRTLLGVAALIGALGCAGSSDPGDGSDNPGVGGTAGTGGTGTGGTVPLDDPFGVGGRSCDWAVSAGGDGCVGAWNSAGFFTDPEHMTTARAGDEPIALSILTEYTPNTPLKLAVQSGVALSAYGSSVELAFEASWSVADDGWAVNYTLVPNQALEDGWYSLLVRRGVREAHGAQYNKGFETRPLFVGGHFVEQENGDLRADFRVGSQPLVARIGVYEREAWVEFSETVEAATPPVAFSIGSYDPTCRPSGTWTGSGLRLEVSCGQPLLGGAVTVAFTEGFVTPGGAPLRGPDGSTEFAVDVAEQSTVELGVPAQ